MRFLKFQKTYAGFAISIWKYTFILTDMEKHKRGDSPLRKAFNEEWERKMNPKKRKNR
jgi:hypothetical protein